jgi:hypothetical protein
MRAVSIGFTRDDGDFELLATLNNSGDHLSDDDFGELVNEVASTLCRRLVCQIDVLERNDAPDVIDYYAICSSICHPEEPCMLTESGKCQEKHK